MSKKTPILFLALLFIFALSWPQLRAQSGTVKSQFTETPKRIDGQDDDWEGAGFFSFKEANVDYALANDNSHLYLILVFHDRAGLSTIEGTGVKIYISQAGKKNKDIAFHFKREQVSAEEAVSRLESLGEVLPEEVKAQILEKKVFAFYEGAPVGKKLKSDLERIKGQKIEVPIFRYQKSRDKVIYEFRIPLQLSSALAPILQPGKSFNVGFDWGGLTDEMKRAIMEKRAEVSPRRPAIEGGVSEESGAIASRDSGGVDFGGKSPKKFNFWFTAELAEAK